MIAVKILAFVYAPLNLATSISGMSLRELNGSGKSLWVFLTTATIALLITGASWFLMEEIKSFMEMYRSKTHVTITQFTIGVRIAMLAWLRKHGQIEWTWKSGAWWRILTNSDSPLQAQVEFIE